MNEKSIHTQRLILIPFTHRIATNILQENYEELLDMGLTLGKGWPDEDAMETIPKIIKALELAGEPTGFESWMIITKDGRKIIGDAGFKGAPNTEGEVDIGYGIIEAERKKGYAYEAAEGLANWALLQPDVKKITAKCLLDNIDSAKLLVKMGFTEIKRDDTMIYWSSQKG
ncbi:MULTISPECIES: GNAT family N-acetyltransferase [Brevibacillus]|uniref:GNAT family N-acetyltransferase n=1 Tax=Brevibacillus TaxID=55080 RepID=UPI000D0E4B23|nr:MULTISPECIES: GNAT family N-acetyltransferase [Brevibacillus]PSJ67981.1 N-acetyltransferase [Brevibacillus brevis]RED35446.1 ribosomal-protein-alanine N-acetyltransferase [Brevibacillus brevis]TQK63768.1 ribosomal-protein-alanine N-acetyltransferase [Brevibacillus sp. AG162]VEF89444.1 anhydro-N-acetylmuramic acid kinase [Brevibacillus brevis]GEC87890.1 N-acetyltransferase [Brevibacillus brevis]